MNQLTFHKETLRRLSAEETDQVAGGIRPTWTCNHTRDCVATAPYRGCDTIKTDCCI